MRMRKKRGMERARAILAVVVRRFVGVIDGEDIVGRSVGAGVEIGVEKVGVELTVMNEVACPVPVEIVSEVLVTDAEVVVCEILAVVEI